MPSELENAYTLHRQKRFAEAEKIYRRLLKKDKKNRDINNLLGLLCLETARPRDACEFLKRALREFPDDPQSWFNLGLAHIQLREFSPAINAFRKAVRLAPERVEARNALGNALRLEGRLSEAGKELREAEKLQPGHPAVLCNMGLLLLENGQSAASIAKFRQAIHIQPNLADAHSGLAKATMASGNWSEAAALLGRAIDRFGHSAEFCNQLGICYNKLGQQSQAADCFRRALKSHPQMVEALLNLGITAEQIGALEEAENALVEAVRLDPGCTQAWFHLSLLKTHELTNAELDLMRLQWNGNDLDDERRYHLGFALGRALEKRSDYQASFRYTKAARTILAKQHIVDLATEEKKLIELRQAFSARADKPGTSAQKHGPVFVFGMPRSGTTVTEQILASHTGVKALGETGLVAMIANKLENSSGKTWPRAVVEDSPTIREQLSNELSAALGLNTEQQVVETTPDNFQYLGLIRWLLPGAVLIHCTRHPLDTCLSIYQHPLSGNHSYANTLESLAGYYKLYLRMMAMWRPVFNECLLEWPLEQLVAEPELSTRRLLNHCGLPFEAACLQFNKTQRTVRTPSASQVRQPLNSAGIGRWKRFAEDLKPLIASLVEEPLSGLSSEVLVAREKS